MVLYRGERGELRQQVLVDELGIEVTFDEIAGIASEVSGRYIRRVVLDDEKWVDEQVAQGTPEPMARFLLGFYQAAREGRFAGVDPLLRDLLGRQPRTVRDLLAG